MKARRGFAAGVRSSPWPARAAASAQATSDTAAAEALFNEAQRLAAAGKYAEACPKYAESLRLDSGIGAMLYLADCWERTGKTASAWAQFREAEQLATQQNDKRAAAAHKRAAQLEPNLARLVIRVGAGVDVPGLDVKRDTTEVGRPQWGVPVPVDPGQHTVTATATGKKPQKVAINVPAGTTPTTLDLVALQDADAVAPAPPIPGAAASPGAAPLPDTPPADDSAHAGGTQRLLGLVAGGVGVVGIGLGTYFGFDTILKNNASNSPGNCSASTNECSKAGVDRSAAKSSGARIDSGLRRGRRLPRRGRGALPHRAARELHGHGGVPARARRPGRGRRLLAFLVRKPSRLHRLRQPARPEQPLEPRLGRLPPRRSGPSSRRSSPPAPCRPTCCSRGRSAPPPPRASCC